jgi:hypothetical protein
MSKSIEITKRQLFSDSHSMYERELIPLEDCKFKLFTDFLDEIDVFKNPIASRGNGKFRNGNWSILGYGTNTYRQLAELQDEEYEDEEGYNTNANGYQIKWEYTIFNGFFTDEFTVTNAPKSTVESKIKEAVRFLEKTFSKELINDVSEARDLQEQLIEHKKTTNLERIDICIITDTLIDQNNLPNKIALKNLDIDCRIYYWDIRRWDAIKRSKSKREPINIDFNSVDFSIYNVPYLHKSTGKSLDYYLAIFPGDLIADLYDIYNTRLLENNVRVFLSATQNANKGIRNTIGDNQGADAYKFFSYNNGISATAESLEVQNGRIIKIVDFQIVNGGQTTASIHYSRKKDSYKLTDVYVAVKITALHKDDEYSKIVSKISQAANTQSSIATSDFYANDKQLVLLEQLSLKNPTQNYLDRNIFYFFERMKGQYNVTKSSQGNTKHEKIWEDSHPKNLSFNKLDFSRWSNMLMELPYHASEGSEKQFKTFMENKYFKRNELNLASFKTLIGFGLMFKRIYKLCGTASGKMDLYPSRIIDFSTGQHVPVAMSTAIYTAAYIHKISKGRLDYWSFYEYKHNLCYSVNSPISKEKTNKRINSDLDEIFESFIDSIWIQIAAFGGAAAQEKSKKKECWDFVVENTQISEEILTRLMDFTISKNELEKREMLDANDDDFNYFNSLDSLLSNNGIVLNKLLEISMVNSEFLDKKNTISNLIKKIKQGDKILPLKRIKETHEFYEKLKDMGYDFDDFTGTILNHKFDFRELYEEIFKRKNEFIDKYYNSYTGGTLSEENERNYKKIKEVIDNYFIAYGVSIDDLVFLQKVKTSLN